LTNGLISNIPYNLHRSLHKICASHFKNFRPCKSGAAYARSGTTVHAQQGYVTSARNQGHILVYFNATIALTMGIMTFVSCVVRSRWQKTWERWYTNVRVAN